MNGLVNLVCYRGGPTVNKECQPQTAFLFLTFLEMFQQSLNKPHFFSCEKVQLADIPWDPDVLNMVVELLESQHNVFHFVSLKLFSNLMAELKLMELIRLLLTELDAYSIVQKLNLFFPRWDEKYEKQVEETFKLKEKNKILINLQTSHNRCRRMLLQLLLSVHKRRAYILSSMTEDLKSLARSAVTHVGKVLKLIRRNLPHTAIEQIQFTAKEDLAGSSDPAIQILLDHLTPDISEAEFLTLIKNLGHQDMGNISIMSCLDPLAEIPSSSQDNHAVPVSGPPISEVESPFRPAESQPFFFETEEVCGLSDRTEPATLSDFDDHQLEVQEMPHQFEDVEIVEDSTSEDETSISQENDSVSTLPDLESHLYLCETTTRPCIVKLHYEGTLENAGVQYKLYQ
ncbi:uncharacterized protein LOC106457518 isoform X2 [Limulus polyphemus]|nr:uncharacterized protein LOC106457518 isoform X2 [Limulus polyphemus]